MVDLQKRPCPVCGNPDFSLVPDVCSVPKVESLTLEQIKPHWDRVKKKLIFLSFYRCEKCRTLVCPYYFSEPQLKQLYENMPDNTEGVSVDFIKETQRGYFNVLRRYSSLEGQYLEVGPDIGLFLEFCVREGRFEKFWLFEPKIGVQDRLKKVLAANPCSIFPSMLDVSLVKGTISTVVMVHVLDHMLDPKSVLTDLKKKLSPSATLLLVTHDESSFLAKLIGRKWGGYWLEHPQLFNPETIRTLLESSGYRVLNIEKSYNCFPVSYLLNRLFTILGMEKIQLRVNRGPAFRIKLGNIITVATPS